MKLHYYPETDSQAISEGIVLDFDDQGKLIGIDIDHASQTVDLTRLDAQSLPLTSPIPS
ncbi:DUF2283 domain-containing protein [Synechococcus sp. C9]|jgi:uncharacterized protein YuzE|uniref:DUF2283 domain-containing protein n=1 Tax=Synechococcus sp. C9 TaxID=102119 RepID=UPI001FF6AFC5|nr:DUF2283 domain-containing protein [Synechococcus sp. C9]